MGGGSDTSRILLLAICYSLGESSIGAGVVQASTDRQFDFHLRQQSWRRLCYPSSLFVVGLPVSIITAK